MNNQPIHTPVEPLEWFSPQGNQHLRAHCYLLHKNGGYETFGIRPCPDGTWNLYSGQYRKKYFATVEDCKAFSEELRNRADYGFLIDWDKTGVPKRCTDRSPMPPIMMDYERFLRGD